MIRTLALWGFVLGWLGLTLAFWLNGLKTWAWLWLGILAAVVIAEVVSKLRTGRTISQRFWAWKAHHPTLAWLFTGGLLAVWLLFLAHLMGCATAPQPTEVLAPQESVWPQPQTQYGTSSADAIPSTAMVPIPATAPAPGFFPFRSLALWMFGGGLLMLIVFAMSEWRNWWRQDG